MDHIIEEVLKIMLYKAKENMYKKMVIAMKEIGIKMLHMDSAYKNLQIVIIIKDSTKWVKRKAKKDITNGKIIINTSIILEDSVMTI